jgi:hypothetical protein
MTAPMAMGTRRVAAGRGADVSGISFVILYQIRLCSAVVTAGTGLRFAGFDDKSQSLNKKS